MEVLMAIAILSIAIVSFLGVISRALQVSEKGRGIAQAVTSYDGFIFNLESGLRADLVHFGGKGELEGGYRYELIPEENSDSYDHLRGKILWKGGREFLNLDLIASEAGVVQ